MTVIENDWLAAEKLGSGKLRVQHDEVDPRNDRAEANLNAWHCRIAGATLDEIDRVIRELESVSEILRKEGERVTREITDYARLNRESMTAMELISNGIKQWKGSRQT